ncbi:phosphatidylserine decarboxylase, partial [Moniliophthora roreri]
MTVHMAMYMGGPRAPNSGASRKILLNRRSISWEEAVRTNSVILSN